MEDTPTPPNPAQWEAYRREPCVLLDQISMVARQVASTTTIPRLWKVVRKPYGLLKNKKREVRVDAGYWELKKVRTYWCHQAANYEKSDMETYCLDTDGNLFSFTYQSEAGLERGRWRTFVSQESDRVPFAANTENFLTMFDWDATAKTETAQHEEIFRSPAAVFDAVERSGDCGLIWCSATGPSQQKGAALLSTLQAMLP